MINCANMDSLKMQPKRRLSWQSLMLMMFTLIISVDGQDVEVCPRLCQCRMIPDVQTTNLRVQCFHGDMTKIPTNRLDLSVAILTIAAPIDQPNHLTIGPIFTQPRTFVKLKELSIVNSNIPSIGYHSFWGLASLKKLNLTHNNVTGIGKDNFKGLLNLVELYLAHNQIGNMPSETFMYCPSLKTLSLTHNQISILTPRVFRMLGKLQVLDLSYNHVKDLNPEVFQDIQSLKVFKCRNCKLNRINPQIYHLAPLLEEIDLSENLFKYMLSDEFANLKRLRSLNLDGNQIPVLVDNVFGMNTNMQTLRIARNRLALIAPNAFTNLTNLKYLDISHNKIERFYLQTFNPIIGSIQTINFSGNNMPLSEVALVLQIIPDIMGVGLANYSLSEFPPNFFMYNDNIRNLDISWNKLTKFPLKAISSKKYLHLLDISHNQLTKLQEADLRRMEGIAQVILTKNKWRCDECSAGSMLKYTGVTALNESLQGVRCHSPMRLRGIKLSNLTYDLLQACPVSHEAQISIVAGLVLVMVAALATVTTAICVSRRRAAAHYYTNEGKRCERAHDHPEELLPQVELSAVATIHTPYAAEDHS